MDSNQAKEMLEAARKNGIKHMVMFNYRRIPAIRLAKQIIQEGRIGNIYHFRAHYLQDWLIDPDFPLTWRLRKDQAGSGVSGDLGSHIIDLARYLVGEFKEVQGTGETFVKERHIVNDTGRRVGVKREVDVDDATLFTCRFDNGALGVFEVSRVAGGRKNYEYIEINGSKGSLIFNFERMNELRFFSREDPPHLQGFRNILVTESIHPFMKNWWHSGLVIGYEETFAHSIYHFLQCIQEDKIPEPNFLDGLRCHQVLDAVAKSIQEKRCVPVAR
jgi:predicted dehydrogenase